jgi:hypothetical protein
MTVVKVLAAAAFGAVLLTGCISAPTGGAKVAYYDGAYGEYHGGFWGADGVFHFYADASHAKIVRDEAGHFQMSAKPGYREVRARPRERRYQQRVVRWDARQAERAVAEANE